MDYQEKDVFYTSDDDYSNLLGIGKPQGFLGLKKLFNTKGYQTAMFQQMQSNRVELTPIQSIGYKPLSVEYGTPTRTTISPLTTKPTSSINTSDLLKNLLDTAIVIGKNKAQQGTTKTETKEETTTTTTQPVVGSTTDDKGYSKDPRGNDVKPDRTMLYVGIAGAGILLISGIAFMASKGK
jgi:hypothetical protein